MRNDARQDGEPAAEAAVPEGADAPGAREASESVPAEAVAPVTEAVAAAQGREELIRAALDRVLASADLSTSPRLAAFLRFVVDATLAGRAEGIKGYTIAVEALGRPASFDPQTDPIVRVEATRLRRAMQNYYNTTGVDDPIRISIPKGGYVPQFEDKVVAASAAAATEPEDDGSSEALLPEEAALPMPAAIAAPVASARRAPWWRMAGIASLAVVAVVAAAHIDLPRRIDNWLSPPVSIADKVRLPIVEVGAFGTKDATGPGRADLRTLEERLRDAFAQFDFVEVRANPPSSTDQVEKECGRSRSVFSLAGLAEGRGDGTYSLLVRLTDRCEGIIVWSGMIDGLHHGPDAERSEQRAVREIAGALMESYGVVPVRARSQVRAKAPGSGFGCIADAFSVLRGDGASAPGAPRICLTELANRDSEFALGHAVRAAALLDEAVRDTASAPSPERAALMLREAELAADLAPSSAYAARTLALVQLFLGETEAAVGSGERALQLNPLDYDVAASVGTVYIGAGRVDEGEALLNWARTKGVARAPLQETYLAIAAFLRGDPFAAQALVPQLRLHPSPENKVALALALHALERDSDEREVVRGLIRGGAGGAEAVRRLVRHLLPAPEVSDRALSALESAGLSQEAAAVKRPHG